MTSFDFAHNRLDVYRVSLEYAAWSHQLAKRLTKMNRFPRDQLLRASQSIPQNIAEGNGRRSGADKRRFFEIARGSALECAAIQDILSACSVIEPEENKFGQDKLNRIVSMLTKLVNKKIT